MFDPTGTLVGLFIGGSSDTIQLGQNVSVQCTVFSTVPQTVTVEWSTTASSADISNQQANDFGNIVSGILSLVNVDSGYCGVYTCTITDSDMMPVSTSTTISVGE